jgi:hypothetical protein
MRPRREISAMACDGVFARTGVSSNPTAENPGKAAEKFLHDRGLDCRFNPTNCNSHHNGASVNTLPLHSTNRPADFQPAGKQRNN